MTMGGTRAKASPKIQKPKRKQHNFWLKEETRTQMEVLANEQGYESVSRYLEWLVNEAYQEMESGTEFD
jgi:hypothetical protein